mgnify:CR=1 FL=1
MVLKELVIVIHIMLGEHTLVNNKQINLGYFENFEDAVQVRKEAEDLYHGEYKWKGDFNA